MKKTFVMTLMLAILIFAVPAVAMPPPTSSSPVSAMKAVDHSLNRFSVICPFTTESATVAKVAPSIDSGSAWANNPLAQAQLVLAGTKAPDGFDQGQPANLTKSMAPPSPEGHRLWRITFHKENKNTMPPHRRPFYNGGRSSGGPTA